MDQRRSPQDRLAHVRLQPFRLLRTDEEPLEMCERSRNGSEINLCADHGHLRGESLELSRLESTAV